MKQIELRRRSDSERRCLPIGMGFAAFLLADGCSPPPPPPPPEVRPAHRIAEESIAPAASTQALTSPELEALEARLDEVTEAVSKSPERSVHGLKTPAHFEADTSSPLNLNRVWMSVGVYWCNDGCIDGPADTPVNDDDLKLLLPFSRSLTMLDLQRTEITDAGLEILAALTSLETLKLAGCKINGSGLAHLTTLNHLQHLDLSDTHFEPEQLQALAALPSLKTVLLPSAKITDDVLAALGRLPQLQSLNLAKSPISDQGLAGIARLKFLETLDLSGTQVTDRGLVHLSGLTNLRQLCLSQTKVQGSGLSQLAKLALLTELELADTYVDDVGLSHLSRLASLQTLDLSRTRVQGFGLEYLKDCRQLHSAKLPPVNVAAIPAINTVKSWHSLKLQVARKGGLPTTEPLSTITIEDMPDLKTLTILTTDSATDVVVKNCQTLELFGLQHDSNRHPGAALRFENLPALQNLSLNGAFREFSSPRAFSQVKRLYLTGGLTSDAVRAMGSFRAVQSVNLKITNVTGDPVPMDELPVMPEVISADVQLKSERDSWIVRLIGRMPALNTLGLKGRSLSGEQLAPLANCQKLTHISIHGVDDPGEPLTFLEAMPDIDQCHILGCPNIGRIRLTKTMGLRRFYFRYGQVDDLEIDGAPNLTEVNLVHSVNGGIEGDLLIPELAIGRLIVHNIPNLLYLRVLAKESAIPFVEVSLSDLPLLRSLTLYTPPPDKQPVRCRLKTSGVYPKLVQRRLFHVVTDQESLTRLNDSPTLNGGELVDVQIDPKRDQVLPPE